MSEADEKQAQALELARQYEALRSRTRALFDANPDMIFRLDADGRYLDFHAADRRHLALKPEDFLGRRMDEIFDAEFAEAATSRIRKALEDNAMQIWEYSMRLHGATLDFEARIVPSGEREVISIVRDITSAKRARQQLQLIESRLNQAQQVAKIGSWDRDLTNDEVWWSEETYRLLDLNPGTNRPSYETFLSRLHPNDRPHVEAAVAESIAQCKPYFAHHRLLLPDGTERIVNSRAYIVAGEPGTAMRLVGTIQDITDRIELEREIIGAGERERERVGRDLHDGLGQTLTGISLSLKALANRLERGQPVPPEILRQLEKNMQEALSETRRAAHLLSPRMAGLRAALDALARQFDQGEIRCGVRGEARHESHDPDLERHLYRIAQEALSNAARHSSARNVELRYRCDGKSIRLEVLDDGIGLPKVDESEGIGFRNMRYRVHMINGTLDLADRPGGGTHIVCSCPCR